MWPVALGSVVLLEAQRGPDSALYVTSSGCVIQLFSE
jgi:hypothetical protein